MTESIDRGSPSLERDKGNSLEIEGREGLEFGTEGASDGDDGKMVDDKYSENEHNAMTNTITINGTVILNDD